MVSRLDLLECYGRARQSPEREGPPNALPTDNASGKILEYLVRVRRDDYPCLTVLGDEGLE